MDLIDEKDYLSLAVDHLLDHSLESFLEFSLVLGSCNEGSEIKGINLPALEVLRHVSIHDLLCDAFRNRRLSDSRLSYKNRIVLCPSAEDLKDSSYLLVSADDRIELSLCRSLIEIHGKPAEVFESVFRHISSVLNFICIPETAECTISRLFRRTDGYKSKCIPIALF